jgi:hypothetical protein
VGFPERWVGLHVDRCAINSTRGVIPLPNDSLAYYNERASAGQFIGYPAVHAPLPVFFHFVHQSVTQRAPVSFQLVMQVEKLEKTALYDLHQQLGGKVSFVPAKMPA